VAGSGKRARVADDADLIALVETYEQSFEEGRSPLVREMAASGGVEAAPRLARSDDPKVRLAAARLMHLLPDERHVAALEPLIADPDPDVAGLAWRALRNQRRTPEWRDAVTRIAADGPEERRAAAADWLAET
jgi:HEAT repeats